MKYYIIAGEASGDLHSSNLMKAIKELDPMADFRCWGGDKMKAEGGVLVKHYKDLAFMGFLEVAKNIGTILRNISLCKTDIQSYHPDVVILVDYPGFNLRIAEWGKKHGFKIVYYISPQIWAWKEGRVKLIQKYVDRMLVILPFEKQFYKNLGVDVDYVGHPLLKVVDSFIYEKNNAPIFNKSKDQGTIALLPGSRKQEIEVKLPIMLSVASSFPDFSFVVAKAPGISDAFYSNLMKGQKNVYAIAGKTYDILHRAKAALVTSGTATLETALFNVPQIICYKGNTISYEIAKRLIKVKYIGLVNLIMDKEVVKELIQKELTKEKLVKELDLILHNGDKKIQIQKDYATLREMLSQKGDASQKAAEIIVHEVLP